MKYEFYLLSFCFDNVKNLNHKKKKKDGKKTGKGKRGKKKKDRKQAPSVVTNDVSTAGKDANSTKRRRGKEDTISQEAAKKTARQWQGSRP